MATIYITSKKLIETLNVSGQELIDLEKFIDADPDDEWELLEGKDYKIVNGHGLREYTETGAYTVAECLEWKQSHEQGWLKRLVRNLITAIRGNVRKTFVKEKILNNASSLALNNDRYFLSSHDVTAIFGTRPDYLRKMAEAAKKLEQPLLKDEDYIDISGKGIYYSLSGLVKLAGVFAETLKNKNRRDWCNDVGSVITPAVDDILKHLEQRSKDINKAKAKAKTCAKKRCQVSGKHGNPIEPLALAGHHLYSQAEYPHLSACIDNIICICEEVHTHFHQFMGGAHIPCTINDFIDYVKLYYPENGAVLTWLAQKQLILGKQELSTQKHVMQLSWPVPKLLGAGKS
jgi:hypothetical protein